MNMSVFTVFCDKYIDDHSTYNDHTHADQSAQLLCLGLVVSSF